MTSVPLTAEEAGAGPALVLLHAFPVTAQVWRRQQADLADVARVVTPNLRGFGGSPLGDDEPSLDVMADDVAALADRLGLDRFVLGGVSMGGYVAMAFLRRHPGRLSGLVLADTKAAADGDAARANRLRIADELDRSGEVAVLLRDVAPGLTGDTTKSTRPDVVAEVQRMVAAADPSAAAWAQRAMARRPDSFATLRAATVPALVVVGAEDELSPPDDARAMADVLPDARVVEVPAAGHLSCLESPEAVAGAVRELVTRAAPPR